MMFKFVGVILAFPLTFSLLATSARAHGVIGKRFIPSTLALEDPFPSDELDLATITRPPKDSEGRETSVGFEFGKRLTPDLAIGIGWEYIFFDPREAGERRTSGAGNPEFGVKYSIFKSTGHEAILSVGLEVEAGGAGSSRVAERVTTISPALYFGKGLGDLPDTLAFLKPVAITGSLSVGNPATRVTGSGEDKERHPTTIDYGMAVMYGVPYLQSFVKDIGLDTPFDRMFPLVEFNMSTNVSKPQSGRTTAFANPGLIWVGKFIQLGLEAQVPMNEAAGKNFGIVGLIHLFVDDIWPNVFTWAPFGVIGPTGR